MSYISIFSILIIAQLIARAAVSLAQRNASQNPEDIQRIIGKEQTFAILAHEMGTIALAAAIGATFITCSAG